MSDYGYIIGASEAAYMSSDLMLYNSQSPDELRDPFVRNDHPVNAQ